jgi:hypothetical protein
MDLTVDTGGLRADASALQGSAEPGGAAPVCQAATSDSVSTHLAASLTTWAQSLHLLNDHAGRLREAGGLALSGTATTLSSADADNAAAIGGILGGAAAAGAASPTVPGGVPDVAPPTLPVLPTLTPPMPMQAEQIAALVHSGPGPQGLRTFASQIRQALGSHVQSTAADVRNAGTSVAQNWRDGQQQAASNIAEHAEWLESSLHPQVLALAGAAEDAAAHTETLIQSTPHPQEFTDLKQRLKVAVDHYNASGGANAAQVASLSGELTNKRATAMAAFQTFATAAPPTINGAAQPPPPAPPIVQNPGGPAEQLQPRDQANPAAKHDGQAGGHDHGGHGPGDPDNPDPADPSAPAPAAPQPAPGLATPPTSAAAADPNAANNFANIAGTLMGAGTGAVGQVTHGLGGGSPLSALSSLSSLPGMGSMPHMGTPEMPQSGGGPDNSSPDGPGDGDFGSGGTTPATGGGGGDAGGGGGGGGAPVSSSSPAVGPPAGSTVSVGGPATGSTTPSGASPGGGMGMMPPMMGGMGGKNDEARKSEERRRVVMRPVANTEAVFGEVRREPRRRADKDKKT